MSDSQPPARSSGWPWTIAKCLVAVVTLSFANTWAVKEVFRRLLTYLPEWVPAWFANLLRNWMFERAWIAGTLLGVLMGMVVSATIVVFDAKRGKLTKL